MTMLHGTYARTAVDVESILPLSLELPVFEFKRRDVQAPAFACKSCFSPFCNPWGERCCRWPVSPFVRVSKLPRSETADCRCILKSEAICRKEQNFVTAVRGVRGGACR